MERELVVSWKDDDDDGGDKLIYLYVEEYHLLGYDAV
jgi:hypothetical protein